MLPLESLLLFAQIFLLIGFNYYLAGRNGPVIQKHFHPFAFFSLFYFLFFITPQFIAIFPPYALVGLDDLGWETRKLMIPQGQLASMVFLVSLMAMYYNFVTYSSFFGRTRPNASMAVNQNRLAFKGVQLSDYVLIYLFFIAGMVSIVYLGITFSNISEGAGAAGGFRSELVKSTSGKIATSLSYFGNFGFAVLFVNAILKRNWLIALILAIAFGSAILMTGSRGRLMWPLLLSGIMLMSYYNRVDVKKVIIGGVAGLFLLLLMDPLMKTVRTGDISHLLQMLNFKAMFESMFFRRNFDGLSNLSLSVYLDEAPKSFTYLFTGARDAFMNTYFPETYASGVGFGVTYPGWLYLSMGWPGLVYGGLLFGFVLGYLHNLLSSIKDFRLYWTYLFMMPWLCAVGGNFIESFDKMLVAIAPGIIWIIYTKLGVSYKRRRMGALFTI